MFDLVFGAPLIVLFVSDPDQEARMLKFSENGHFQVFLSISVFGRHI